MLPVLAGKGPGHGNDGSLGPTIDAQSGLTMLLGLRGDADHRATLSLYHVVQDGPRAVQEADNVQIEVAAPCLSRPVSEGQAIIARPADDIDQDPLDPAVGEIIDELQDDGSGNYLWIAIILIIVAVLGAAFMLAKKPQPVIEDVPEEPILETELCPKCGFDIEKGSACPFCVEEKPPKPEPPKPKPKFTNEEMLEKVEKSYREGKLTKEQYQKNRKKFGG